MSTNSEIVKHLNIILRNELTAINQYFLHARMLKNWGLMKLADHEYKESIEEMKHADTLVERVLFLKGLPNLQNLGKLFIGENVKEILECDMKLEEKANIDLKEAIAYLEANQDYTSADILHRILENEEEHVLFIRTQLNLIASMGMPAYMQTQI